MNYYKEKYYAIINFRKVIQPFNRWNKLPKESQQYNLPPAYGEYYHIKPKCLYPELAHNKDNIVCLTAQEHVLAHVYLALWYLEEYGEDSNEFQYVYRAYDKVIMHNNGRQKIQLNIEDAAKLRIKGMSIMRQKLIEQYSHESKRKQISEAVKKAFTKPEIYDKMCRINKELSERPEAKERQRKKFKQWNTDPAMRQKQIKNRDPIKIEKLKKRIALQNKNPNMIAKQQFSKLRNRIIKLYLLYFIVNIS